MFNQINELYCKIAENKQKIELEKLRNSKANQNVIYNLEIENNGLKKLLKVKQYGSRKMGEF